MSAAVANKSPPVVLHASTVARAHTYLALAAFSSALVLGCALHYKRIVKNSVAGYPEEWFPSVSATIGDWYPERNIFQILIAINAGPRFALSGLQYYLHRTPSSSWPGFLLLVGLLRTLSCGGWVFITSSDDHDVHDVLMITYIVLNIPWMFGSLACTPTSYIAARRRRRWTSLAFFASIAPMVYYFIQHKVHHIPGAYTRYSFFEWSLIIFDILYDSSTELDFSAADLKVAIGSFVGAPGEHADKIADASTNVVKVQSIAVPEKGERVSEKHAVPVKTSAFETFSSGFMPTVSFASDVYLSYIYWSVYTALTPTLFYFSVWQLGIAGQELALLSTLAPVFLGISPFKQWAHTQEGRAILHGFSLVGLAAYVSRSPLTRLFLVAFANSAAAISAAVEWFGGDVDKIAYQALVAGIGFLVSSLSKHANHTNNPVWPIVDERSGGYNKTGLALAFLAILEFSSRTPTPVPVSTPKKTPSKTATSAPHWFPTSLALGGLIFSLHCFLSDSSTLIAWAWTGYPLTGPLPSQHGSLTHVAQALGLVLATSPKLRSALEHPLYFAFGAGSAYVAYAYKDWTGYAGGLGLAFFLMSLIPGVWARAAAAAGRTGVGRVAATAWLVVALFDVASVFTVAYAFVPGAWYFRERTNWVLATQFLCLAFAFDWRRSGSSPVSLALSARVRNMVYSALAVVSVMSFLVTLYRTTGVPVPTPHRASSKIVRAGVWTVHFGIDNEGRDSQRAMRNLIKDMELDVVGLIETDLHRVVFGNRDLSRVIAEDLGYYVDIGPGPNQHTWGVVLLSKFPIINSTHHLLPSPYGELAPAIEAHLDMYGTPVKVIVAHNGQEETPLDRELQSTELARIMSESYPDPVIFLGYVVTKPHAARPSPYDIMVTDGRVHDIDQDDMDRWCEYIFYRGLYRTSYARISRGSITDTEMQIGQFVVPKYGVGVVDESHEARYIRSFKETLPKPHWFPMAYYPQRGGKNGHWYHVFDTPLYYDLPEGAQV